MKVQVKPLRSGGVRMSDRQIQSMQPIDGVIRVYRLGATIQVCLSAYDDQQVKPLLPYLYDAQLVTMHGNGMLLFGFERNGGPMANPKEQEWSVKIVSL